MGQSKSVPIGMGHNTDAFSGIYQIDLALLIAADGDLAHLRHPESHCMSGHLHAGKHYKVRMTFSGIENVVVCHRKKVIALAAVPMNDISQLLLSV